MKKNLKSMSLFHLERAGGNCSAWGTSAIVEYCRYIVFKVSV